MPTTLTPARVEALLTLLAEADVPTTVDSAKITVPGAWLTIDTIRRANVAGDYRYGCSLYLITGDTDTTRVLESLLAELTKVLTVLTPDGEVVATRVVRDADPTPLPALRVPVNL